VPCVEVRETLNLYLWKPDNCQQLS